MADFNSAVERLGLAMEVVEKTLGSLPLDVSAPLVAAVLQSITMDEQAERFGREMERLRALIARAAPFAGGS